MTANPLPFRKDVVEEMQRDDESKSNSVRHKWHIAAAIAILLILAAIAYPLYSASDALSDWWSETWNTRPDTTTASHRKIPDPLALISSRLDSLEQQRAADGAAQHAMRGDIDAMHGELEQFATRDELEALREAFDQFRRSQNTNARRLTALERMRTAAIASSDNAATPVKQAPEPPQLPFRVLSIDLWDGKPYVAVAPMDSGDIELLSVGERRVGWEVRSLDYPAGQALFVDENGRTVQQTAEDFRP